MHLSGWARLWIVAVALGACASCSQDTSGSDAYSMASDLQREVEELKDRADDADKLKARIEELESDVSSLEDQILYLEEGVQQAKNQASNAEGMAMSRR